MTQPIFIIVAGVNGSGKTTLYTDNRTLFSDTKRVNADEILRQHQGDWQSSADNLRAMRMELKLIRKYIQEKVSFHMETTLAGNGKTQQELITQAQQQGFLVTLLYIGVSSPQIAIDRVAKRVAKGGHGVPTELILKRFRQSLANLPKIARSVDAVKIYSNEPFLELVYARDHNQVLQDLLVLHPWLPQSNEFYPLQGNS
ncbi:MAG: zeta toxin family protein [Levilactobacillus sp.]|jgi:predicted ABC-type ATPase|uniref:UDP-N-acetylglucosamine kinase n=1 Tax=Levilactobacillus suantsaiihabitans TaxID=2487722 RepID=A0A4Z0JDI5_9LACO|nr:MULTISPECIES: zeta toxin family protein [Levilactobacillus]MCI1552902.1 zeta toxin family protein [Levilactobacillus sp.]MCI1598042.1 zeta toxin family protein [Levilactobacillus sp.]MCI1605678.1 zeta toxin family protein [Levilactobacillus sp.]TGD20031.1 ATPase [Levilactobacillus suantsaiihabitans]